MKTHRYKVAFVFGVLLNAIFFVTMDPSTQVQKEAQQIWTAIPLGGGLGIFLSILAFWFHILFKHDLKKTAFFFFLYFGLLASFPLFAPLNGYPILWSVLYAITGLLMLYGLYRTLYHLNLSLKREEDKHPNK